MNERISAYMFLSSRMLIYIVVVILLENKVYIHSFIYVSLIMLQISQEEIVV